MPQFVKLVNEDARPFDFHHKNKKRVIPPYGDAVVPWDLACTLFGDPFLLDDGKNNDRTRVAKQVRGLFGFQPGMMTDDRWQEIRPHVAVYDLETQERIYMLLEDPDGLHSLPNPTEVDQSDQVAFLTRQIAQLTAIVSTLQADKVQQETAEAQVVPSVGSAEGQVNATSTDAPNQEPETYTLEVSTPPEPVREDKPHTPSLPPRPKK